MDKQKQSSDKQTFAPENYIIHLGAGRCSELDYYLTLKSARMLLVEADPQLSESLLTRTTNCPHVKVINSVVAGHSGTATFYRYNLPDVGSLHKAGPGLMELFPGLKMVQEIPVEAVAPATLIQPLQLQADLHNQLIIDLPGEELPVIKELQQADQLHLFEQLSLHCGRQPLYEDSESAATIIQWLKEKGFDLFEEDDSHDPECPTWTFKRNKLQVDHRELQQQLTQIKKTSDEQACLLKERQDLVERLTKALDDLAKRTSEYQAQVEQLTQAQDEQVKRTSEYQAQVEQLTHAQDEQVKRTSEYQAQVEQLTQAQDEQVKRASECQAQVEQLTQARDEQVKRASEYQAQVEQLTQARDELAKLASEHQAQLESVTKERGEQAKLATDRMNRIVKLEEQLDDMGKRQVILLEEMHRAGGQIDFIKDVLMGGSG